MRRTWTDAQLVVAVAESTTLAEVLRKLGLRNPGSYPTVKRHIARLELDTSHFCSRAWSKALARRGRPTPLDELLVRGRRTHSGRLKRRLIEAGIFEDACSSCGISSWQGRALVMHLDHINGEHTDNRLENLRLLCPNCHSQTETYCRGPRREPALCATCGTRRVHRDGARCKSCVAAEQPTKIDWPDSHELAARVESRSYRAVARELGVSDNAVRKRLARHPPHDGVRADDGEPA